MYSHLVESPVARRKSIEIHKRKAMFKNVRDAIAHKIFNEANKKVFGNKLPENLPITWYHAYAFFVLTELGL